MDNETKTYIDNLFNEQNKNFEKIWDAVLDLQTDMNRFPPRQKIIHQPSIATEKTMDDNIRRGINDARKSDSFLNKTKPMISMQTKLDTWNTKTSIWTYKQWEEWARSLYNTYPDARKYLPDWFIRTLE
jgi:hypothetical protein